MAVGLQRIAVVLIVLAPLTLAARFAHAQNLPCLYVPDQRTIQVRDPSQLPPTRIPDIPPPPTVTEPRDDLPELKLSLDDAIRIALANSEVVRVLAGISATSSGRTIYDTAIVNNEIDQRKARFDPVIEANNRWNRFEQPGIEEQPPGSGDYGLGGSRTDEHAFDLGIAKTTITGGTARLGVNADTQRFPLAGRRAPSSLEMSYTQPLLQGGGLAANLTPIVLARIDTERSYFQFKDSVQELVRGVIEAYWSLVAARTEVWARKQQVDQTQFAFDRAEAAFEVRIADAGELAQTRVSLANFRSSLLTASNSVLEREAALRNILGLPPMDERRLIPVSAPSTERTEFLWRALLELAGERRPDVIELKLILEADQQLLLQTRNQARPRVDAVGLYRWNGLIGEVPGEGRFQSRPGQFTDWTLGVNFSVPLGLRQERAALRSQELIIARDRAHLDQAMHSVAHILAQNLRSLARSYEQYLLSRETREAAQVNLNFQLENYIAGRIQYINVLLAINDWGNAISAEALNLTQYNFELANLERQTGTILETHGIRFYEERFCTLGPLGALGHGRESPAALPPGENLPRYPVGDRPAEESFHLENPVERLNQRRTIPEEIPRPPPRPGSSRYDAPAP